MAACVCRGCTTGGACLRFASEAAATAAIQRRSHMMDKARDLLARAGLRPYVVSIIRTRASGGRRRGDGVTDVVREWRILPTPKLADLTTLQEIVAPDQVREQGSVLLSGISLSYSEDVLLGRGSDGSPIPADEAVFYEVRFVAGNGQRRRFVPSSAPSANGTDASWSIMLTRVPVDRDRRGVPR